jgi:hypothetical protein
MQWAYINTSTENAEVEQVQTKKEESVTLPTYLLGMLRWTNR